MFTSLDTYYVDNFQSFGLFFMRRVKIVVDARNLDFIEEQWSIACSVI